MRISVLFVILWEHILKENLEMMKVISLHMDSIFWYPTQKKIIISQIHGLQNKYVHRKTLVYWLFINFQIIDENVLLHKSFLINYKYIISLFLTIRGSPHNSYNLLHWLIKKNNNYTVYKISQLLRFTT